LSADLELHTGKIWQRLDSHLESLSKQLAEKAEENGMVSTLYKRKDAECEEHLNELAMLRATTEKQADQIHELEASLVVSDAAQDQNEETIRRLEERATDTERLREEVKSKTAAVAELQSRLDTKEAAFSSELQNCSSNIQKLANTLQERDQSLNTAAQQAAEAARREVRQEMEEAHAKTERSLQETTKDRDSLASQVAELKRQVQEKKTSESRDAAAMRSLQQSLAMEEARGKLAAEKLAQRSTDLEEVENKLAAPGQSLGNRT
jgi:chromosome segregation ATPase